ncbi:helix-turn-helix transcriptional regulator [Alcanivorax sp. S6407]|uniref:helix-turn-helix transcriptional regulator n=1 Tax=Alcanivorax sp. S6407 TaxID=2926424 RepID=UPI001FF5E2EA|nr:helix-turn-helix transcriptional regulator [Alcanivorax sp. S6407]MCK0154314.1 helix-turn-helix transcriptional regulator [Alcanivorax sp. S6407]
MASSALEGLRGKAHESLLDTLYDAPCNPDAWPRFLDQLIEATGSRSARMLVMDRAAQTVKSSIKQNIDDADHQAYVSHFVNTCPWRPELKDKAPGQLYSTYLDFSCPQERFYQTEFYNDWASLQDIHHGVCGTVWQDDHQTVQLLIQRTRGQGHYQREETDRINELVMHVRRALRLQTQVSALDHTRMALEQTLEIQAQPFALLDRHGRIAHVSQEAKALLSELSQVSLANQQLSFLDPRLQSGLLKLLKEVTRPSSDPGFGSGGVILLPISAREGIRCLVSPLHGNPLAQQFTDNRQPLAIIYFQDPRAEVYIDLECLMQLYGLSEAESRVAAGISRGLGPQQVADTYQLSVHTVRTQLKSIFYKTRTTRQSELAKEILTSPAVRHWRSPDLKLSRSA